MEAHGIKAGGGKGKKKKGGKKKKWIYVSDHIAFTDFNPKKY